MTFSFFSLSPIEILILLFGGLLCVGLVVGLVVLLVVLPRAREQKPSGDRLAELEAENRRLREEIHRRKMEPELEKENRGLREERDRLQAEPPPRSQDSGTAGHAE